MKISTLSVCFLLPGLAACNTHQSSCKCLWGSTCWPNNSSFTALASQLSHPLIYPVPPESACYPASHPSGNCTDVISHAGDGNWRSDQSGNMQNTNFEAYYWPNGTINACYLNATLGIPCQQGSIAPIGVDAYSVADIQATVKFAAKNNIRLVVKNTGHDYLGRSTARGALLLWTHHLKNITYNPSFVPDGAPSGKVFNAITFGAGVQWHEAYSAAQAQGRFVVGGISAGGSVGAAGGWIMGGGHSAFSPRYGLGVDNVIQFTIVIASGEHLTVNAYKNQDLFWALRGGGGGTYGVVTSATYLTHDIVPVTFIVIQTNFSSSSSAQSVITEHVRLLPSLTDAGWGGYNSISNGSFSVAFVAPNISVANATATIQPFAQFVQNKTGTDPVFYVIPFASFYDLYNIYLAPATGQVGYNVELGSRLLSTVIAKSGPAKVANILLSINGGIAMNIVAGGAVSRVDPESTGLNTAWRQTVALVYLAKMWADGDSIDTIETARQSIKDGENALNGLSVNQATYLNEASLYQQNFQLTFFGSHYPRLKLIKQKYDQSSLFVVPLGVGSEDWDASINCRRF